MRVVRHPLVRSDLRDIADHIVRATRGDYSAAARRLDEARDLIAAIRRNPNIGSRLSGTLSEWRVRHGGRDRAITIVFKADPDTNTVFVALVAFGGRDWIRLAAACGSFGP
jgi:plasmid stabilization system protein ParE